MKSTTSKVLRKSFLDLYVCGTFSVDPERFAFESFALFYVVIVRNFNASTVDRSQIIVLTHLRPLRLFSVCTLYVRSIVKI